MGKIFIISSSSGAGKTAIIDKLKNETDIDKIKTVTTRPIRDGEINKVDYDFITIEDFKRKIDNNEFIEYDFHYNNYYGLLKSELNNYRNNSKNGFLILDVNGFMTIKNLIPDEILSIFIKVPKDELKNRLINRDSDSDSQIRYRLNSVEYEYDFIPNFDYVIENINIDSTVKDILNIINRELK